MKDILENQIKIGMYCVASYMARLRIFKVINITDINVHLISEDVEKRECHPRAEDILIIDTQRYVYSKLKKI